jgi:hypothetical protein
LVISEKKPYLAKIISYGVQIKAEEQKVKFWEISG